MNGIVINIVADEEVIGYSQEGHFRQREDVHELLYGWALERGEREGGKKMGDQPFLILEQLLSVMAACSVHTSKYKAYSNHNRICRARHEIVR